jgi:diguanylate cyclase
VSKYYSLLWLPACERHAIGGKNMNKPMDLPKAAEESINSKDVLTNIGIFLSRHGLPVSHENLTLAHIAATNSDPLIARKIRAREDSEQEISQEWLNSIAEDWLAENQDRGAVENIGKKLEELVAGFSETIHSTHTQTGQFREEMALKIEEVEGRTQESETGQAAVTQNAAIEKADRDSIVAISQAMLNTLGRIEHMIEQSQAETETLRCELEVARQQASTDQLTTLPNRRAFDIHFEEKAGTSLFVAICDVDHFKRVNDEFGHQTGDNLLRAIAHILESETSGTGFVARHGGEEFAVLFAGVDQETAIAELNAAREELADRKFVARRKRTPIGTITFSAGIADVMAAGQKTQALALADEALYKAKAEGRNTVVAADQV